MLFQTKDELIQILHKIKSRLQTEWPIEHLWLFGSWVRDEARHGSDVDLMIQFRTEPQSRRIGLFEFMDILFEFEDTLGCKVDLVEKSALKPHLAKYILPEAIEL